MVNTIVSHLSTPGGVLAATITGLLGWVVARTTARSQVEAKQIEANAPQWGEFSDKLMERLEVLEKRVRELESQLDERNKEYWLSIGLLRRVLSKAPEVLEEAGIPVEIAKDVYNQ